MHHNRQLPNISDFLTGDEPALLAWQATIASCHAARVERIMAEAAERRRRIDEDGGIDYDDD